MTTPQRRFRSVRVDLPGPPPWSCVLWLPESAAMDEAGRGTFDNVLRDIIDALRKIAPDQIGGIRISPPGRWPEE